MKANDFKTAVKVIKDRLPYYLMLIDDGEKISSYMTEKGQAAEELEKWVRWLESEAARWNTSACACEKCVCGKQVWTGHDVIDLS